MNQFIWLIESKRIERIKSAGGISNQYILQADLLEWDAKELIDARIWMLLKGAQGNLPYAHIRVTQIEQFEDGLNKGDYLLTVDLSHSFLCFRTYSQSPELYLKAPINLEIGLHKSPDKLFQSITHAVKSLITKKITPPSPDVFESISRTGTHTLTGDVYRQYITEITSHFSLDEVWCKSNTNLYPFAYFAFHLACTVGSPPSDKTLLEDLYKLDPFEHLKDGQPTREPSHRGSNQPSVDLNFAPIDPNNIFSRKFLGPDKPTDLSKTLAQTSRAEKVHQDMLRDISEHLISQNITPLQSASIDLFFKIKDTSYLFELKSSHTGNLLTQSAKGCHQLARYKLELNELDVNVMPPVLIVEKTNDLQLNKYVMDVNQILGVRTFFYDKDAEWPHKLPALTNLISR